MNDRENERGSERFSANTPALLLRRHFLCAIRADLSYFSSGKTQNFSPGENT